MNGYAQARDGSCRVQFTAADNTGQLTISVNDDVDEGFTHDGQHTRIVVCSSALRSGTVTWQTKDVQIAAIGPFGAGIPKEPVVCMQAPETVQGPNNSARIFSNSTLADEEIELAILIGERRYFASQNDAKGVIAGRTVSHDVCERYVRNVPRTRIVGLGLKRVTLALFAVGTVLILSGCGSSGNSATADDVRDQVFITDSVTEGEISRPLAAGSQLTLTFAEDGISANANCNTIFGPGGVIDGILVTDGPLASTMMACDQPLMDQDQWLSEFLVSQPSATRSEGSLVLTSPTISMTLQPKASEIPSEEGLTGDESEIVTAVEALCGDLVRAGATVDEATAAAGESSFTVRVIKRDGESLAVTMDYVPSRLNLEIEGDIVTACTSG